MKRFVATLVLTALTASMAPAVDLEDFVGRYSGTAQASIDLPGGADSGRMQGRVVLRVRDESIQIEGDLSGKSDSLRLRYDLDLDPEENDIRARPAFPFEVDKDSLVTIADLQVTRIKGGYRLSSGDLRWRDQQRARGFFTLERTGEEITLEYFLRIDDNRRLRLTVNADR